RTAVLRETDDTGRIRSSHPAAVAAFVAARVELEGVGRRPAQVQRVVLVAVVVGILVAGLVVDVAVARSLGTGETRRQNVVDQRTRQHSVFFLQSVVTCD